MKSTRSTHSSDSGFSIAEFIVTSTLGLIILGICLSTFSTSRALVRYDMDRTSLNQNLRGALDILGMNVRLAGENLPGFFPAIVVQKR